MTAAQPPCSSSSRSASGRLTSSSRTSAPMAAAMAATCSRTDRVAGLVREGPADHPLGPDRRPPQGQPVGGELAGPEVGPLQAGRLNRLLDRELVVGVEPGRHRAGGEHGHPPHPGPCGQVHHLPGGRRVGEQGAAGRRRPARPPASQGRPGPRARPGRRRGTGLPPGRGSSPAPPRPPGRAGRPGSGRRSRWPRSPGSSSHPPPGPGDHGRHGALPRPRMPFSRVRITVAGTPCRGSRPVLASSAAV